MEIRFNVFIFVNGHITITCRALNCLWKGVIVILKEKKMMLCMLLLISLNFFFFGKTTGAIEVGKINLLAANAKLHRPVQGVISLVKTAYYNTLEKKRLIDVASEAVKSYQQNLDRAKLYRRAGVRTKIDVINAEVEFCCSKFTIE